MSPASLLVLGGDGLVGHRAVLEAVMRGITVTATTRRHGGALLAIAPRVDLRAGVDLDVPNIVESLIDDIAPTAVINAAGLVKQRDEAADTVALVSVNSLLPHRVAAHCRRRGIRLVNVSTDCVFSGGPGDRPHGYHESDLADATDLYGRSKLVGEIEGPGCCTVRTSVVGRELRRRSGLLEWLLAEQGAVSGWTRARFSGLSSIELARRLTSLALDHPEIEGVWHLAAEPVTKFDLISQLAAAYQHPVEVLPSDDVEIDRVLDGRALDALAGWSPPSWRDMAAELASDPHQPHRPHQRGTQ